MSEFQTFLEQVQRGAEQAAVSAWRQGVTTPLMVCFQTDAEAPDEVAVIFPVGNLVDYLVSCGIPEEAIDEHAVINQAFTDAIPRWLKAVGAKRFAIVAEAWHVPKRPDESDEHHAANLDAWCREHGPDSFRIHPRRRELLSIVGFDRDGGAASLQGEIKRVGKRRKPRLQRFKMIHTGASDALDGRIPNIACHVFAG